jgi:hypothetical protein
MKRQNYFKVHANKNPKKLPRKKYNIRQSKVAAVMASHILNIEIIKNCKNMSIQSKIIAIAKEVIHTASRVKDIYSSKSKYLEKLNKNKHGRTSIRIR